MVGIAILAMAQTQIPTEGGKVWKVWGVCRHGGVRYGGGCGMQLCAITRDAVQTKFEMKDNLSAPDVHGWQLEDVVGVQPPSGGWP